MTKQRQLVDLRAFDRLTQEILGPLLVDGLGFKFVRGAYHRRLPKGVIQLITIDVEPRRRLAFRVLMGLNADVIAMSAPEDEVGAYYAEYVEPSGISVRQHSWPSTTLAMARTSLEIVRDILRRDGQAWLDGHATLRSLAEHLGPEYDFLKGKLFMAEGDLKEAQRFLEHYRGRLEAMVETADVLDAKREVESLLRKTAS